MTSDEIPYAESRELWPIYDGLVDDRSWSPEYRIDVYSVGALGDWKRMREEIKLGRKSIGYIMQYPGTWKYRPRRRFLANVLRAFKFWRSGQWNARGFRMYLNGYLAEPDRMPEGVRRCGSGWTKRRALRSLAREYRKAGLTLDWKKTL